MPINDTAVCIAYFEPQPSEVTANNFLRACRSVLSARAPLFTVELVRQQPGVSARGASLQNEMPAENCFVYSSEHLMFHKENLLNMAARRIPQQYTKLCFVDADHYFVRRATL